MWPALQCAEADDAARREGPGEFVEGDVGLKGHRRKAWETKPGVMTMQKHVRGWNSAGDGRCFAILGGGQGWPEWRGVKKNEDISKV